MKVHYGIESFSPVNQLVVTLGMYDGVHKGHRALLSKIQEISEERGGESALLTFEQHPRLVLQKDTDLELLTLNEEKIELLQDTKLQHLIIHPFTLAFSRISSVEFVRDYLVNQLQISTLVVGHDHQFGRNREGDFEKLQETAELYGFELIRLDAVKEEESAISSTKIRNALKDGDLDFANAALGYSYMLHGTVIKGDGIGRKLGFPTLNLSVHPKKLIPANGVYGVEIEINNRWYWGAMNIGTRPTLQKTEPRIEVFVVDFDEVIYEQSVKIQLKKRIRDEKKFDSIENLKTQIQQDVADYKQFRELNP